MPHSLQTPQTGRQTPISFSAPQLLSVNRKRPRPSMMGAALESKRALGLSRGTALGGPQLPDCFSAFLGGRVLGSLTHLSCTLGDKSHVHVGQRARPHLKAHGASGVSLSWGGRAPLLPPPHLPQVDLEQAVILPRPVHPSSVVQQSHLDSRRPSSKASPRLPGREAGPGPSSPPHCHAHCEKQTENGTAFSPRVHTARHGVPSQLRRKKPEEDLEAAWGQAPSVDEGTEPRRGSDLPEVTEQKRDTGKDLVADFKAIARYSAKGPTCPEPWAALSPEHPWGCCLWLQGHHRATSRGCDKAPQSTNSRPARHALISGPAIQAGRNQTSAVSRAHDHQLL